MAGCEACEQQVQALIQAKEESGEELTEQERKIAEGEAETPLLYGPLAFWVDIPWCSFCVTVGIVLAFMVDGLLYLLAPHINPFLPFQITKEFLVVFLIVEIFMDLLFGRYPVLGAVFGPYFERFFAMFGIYLTWDAIAAYGPGMDSGAEPIFTQGLGGPSQADLEMGGGGGQPQGGGGRSPIADGGDTKGFDVYGTEIHVIPTTVAVQRCMDPQVPGALIAVEIEETPVGHRVVDIHNFDPEVNRFENIHFHVNPRAPTVCQQSREDFMTELDFRRFIQSRGREGMS